MGASEGRNLVQGGYKCTTSAPGEYVFMQLDVSECADAQTVLERAGAGGQIFGITYENTAAANRHIGVNTQADRCYLKVDADAVDIAVGDYLKSDASGRGVKTTTAGDEVGAIALQAATAADQIIPVQIRKMRY